jgi:hypothetical protein
MTAPSDALVGHSCSAGCVASCSGVVGDGLESTCYSTAVCIAGGAGEGDCDFYADDLLLAPCVISHHAVCMCVCVRACVCVWSRNACCWFLLSHSATAVI